MQTTIIITTDKDLYLIEILRFAELLRKAIPHSWRAKVQVDQINGTPVGRPDRAAPKGRLYRPKLWDQSARGGNP